MIKREFQYIEIFFSDIILNTLSNIKLIKKSNQVVDDKEGLGNYYGNDDKPKVEGEG